jgi:two-component system, cell cycle response regulator
MPPTRTDRASSPGTPTEPGAHSGAPSSTEIRKGGPSAQTGRAEHDAVFTRSTPAPPGGRPDAPEIRIGRPQLRSTSLVPTLQPQRPPLRRPGSGVDGPEKRTTTEFPAVIPRRVLSEEAPSYQLSPARSPMASLDLDSVFERETDPGHTLPLPEEPRAPVRAERAILTVLTGVNAGQVFTLDHAENVIGRSREAQVRIDDVGISRRHTRVVRTEEGRFYVEDLGSTNGTFVAARRIERLELRPGDRVQVGPNVLFRFSMIDATEEHLARSLYEASTRDALTRAFNRKYFVERLTAEVAYATRHKSAVAVVLFDLDHFKAINDTHGHLAGDVVLRFVAAQVQRTIRLEDVLARYGGEEFVIIVRGIEHAKVAVFAERVRRAVETLVVPYEALELHATISVGAASLEQCGDGASPEALLLLADERLYQAKGLGRNRVSA